MKPKIIRLNFEAMQKMIILPERDEMTRIWTIINEHGFVFNRFTLVAEPIETTYKVEIVGRGNDQVFHIKTISKDRTGKANIELYNVTIGDMLDKYATLMVRTFKEGYKAALHNPDVDLLCPFNFMQYVVYSDLHRTIEHVEPAARASSTPARSHSSKSTKEYSLTDCIKIYHHKNENRSYERKTATWERRGGIRHLKSGKVVPYAASICHAKEIPGTHNETSTEYRL